MKLRRGGVYGALLGASTGWVAAVFAAPWARAGGLVWGELIYSFFAPVCHQMPGRSLLCWGEPAAVCHRCLGLYAGFAAGLLVLGGWERAREALLDRPRWIVVFAVPMLVDAVVLPLVGVANIPASRFLTGLIAASPLGLLVWAAAQQILDRQGPDRRAVNGRVINDGGPHPGRESYELQ